MTKPTKSQEVDADVAALLRARNPLIWIVTREEARVERYLLEAAASASYIPRTWDVGQGVAELDGTLLPNIGDRDIGVTLDAVRDRAQTKEEISDNRGLWILRDLPVWVNGPQGAATLRQVRNLARLLPGIPRSSAQALVVLSPSGDVPAELAGHTTVIEWPLPDREEIAAILDAAINSLPVGLKETAAPNGTREAAIDAAIGLTGEEAASCYARSLVQLKKIDPTTVAKEKKRVVARERVIEWFDPLPGGLDAVGGLDHLKTWLLSRSNAWSPAARAYGLPTPKGAVVVGIPGTGKSLTAKAVATAYGCPLLRLDLGALKSKFVGESEGNLRKAFKVIEAIGRCVVWLDEIEKSLQGATSGSSDGGVSSDALGAILSWMQERQGEAFVFATANDVESLPPELLRKGRFDEVWFVDLPTATERSAVLAAALRAHNRAGASIDLGAVSVATKGFTGAEIAALVPDALFAGFGDGSSPREITTADLVAAAEVLVPISRTAGDKIAKLQAWAKGNARPASAPEAVLAAASSGRTIDL